MLWLGTMSALVPVPVETAQPALGAGVFPAADLVRVEDERAEHLVPPTRERSKKELWLAEKATRPYVHISDSQLRLQQENTPKKKLAKPAKPAILVAEALAEPRPPVGTRIQPLTTLHNQWTRELMPLIPGQAYLQRFQSFLRDHFTNETTHMDPRLLTLLASAAAKFHAQRIDVVSGYRSPKYNLMLRKKGHQVARESQHTMGTAVDFRVRGVPTETLLGFVRSLHLGGVGFYPHSQFIHGDTGRVRFWKGS